jgi:TorA maturation chaperone TorD
MELIRALGALAELPGREQLRLAELLTLDGEPTRAEYTHLFVLELPPYASPYLGEQGMLGGAVRERVTGFWGALAELPPPEADHLAALLGLYAGLIEAEATAGPGDPARAALRRQARGALLWEHLASWCIPYCAVVADLAAPYYAGWAGLLRAALLQETAELGPPAALPLHLRAAPELPAPDAPSADWLAALLAPVRSGLFLTRADLRRGAREAGVGVRAGERAFMLRAMLEQDAPATASWLIGEAGRWAERHRDDEVAVRPVAAFWRRRAEATGAALRVQVGGRDEPAAAGRAVGPAAARQAADSAAARR